MINREQLENKVIEVVMDTLALQEKPGLDQHLRNDLEADSIDIVTLLVTLEDEMDIPIESSELETKNTLQEIIDFLDEKFQQGKISA
jgi:acyl carrier protein